MTRIKSCALASLITLVCCTSGAPHQLPADGKKVEGAQNPAGSARVHEHTIRDAVGVVVLGGRDSRDKFIHLYNEDGSLWHKFSFYDDAASPARDDFTPLSFHPDYFVLALKCVGQSGERFEVVVNEESGLKKYVRADDRALKFQTWEEHLLQVTAVDFDRQDNPLLAEPGGAAKSTSFPKGATFRPVEMRGDWLRVRASDQGREGGTAVNDGWIRWRKDGTLLVELFYFS